LNQLLHLNFYNFFRYSAILLLSSLFIVCTTLISFSAASVSISSSLSSLARSDRDYRVPYDQNSSARLLVFNEVDFFLPASFSINFIYFSIRPLKVYFIYFHLIYKLFYPGKLFLQILDSVAMMMMVILLQLAICLTTLTSGF